MELKANERKKTWNDRMLFLVQIVFTPESVVTLFIKTYEANIFLQYLSS